jgi:hypothetical protein
MLASKADNTEPFRKTLAVPDDQVLSVSEADERKTLK